MITPEILSSPFIGPPTDIKDDSMPKLAVITNDLGYILEKKGQAAVVLQYYQAALQFLMESLR